MVCQIQGKAQHYDWGKLGWDSKVAQLAAAYPSVQIQPELPYAELWMGTHPTAPSTVYGVETTTLLKSILDSGNLSHSIAGKYKTDIPFLLKVLSIRKALSIQAHPDKVLAKELFKNFPQIYKDPNHKPEMAIALTNFEALIGFKPLEQIKAVLLDIPELADTIGESAVSLFNTSAASSDHALQKQGLKVLFEALMKSSNETVTLNIRKMINRLEKKNAPSTLECLLIRLDSQFADDIGSFCALLLNYVTLVPGEAIFLAANEPHAYLSGDCVECMAASDNVVRSGLTPKFKDVDTLTRMLTYNFGSAESQILRGESYKNSKTSVLYNPPIDEFSIIRTLLLAGCSETFSGINGPSIIIVTEGNGSIRGNHQSNDVYMKRHTLQANKGHVFFIPANEDIVLSSHSEVTTFYRAFCEI